MALQQDVVVERLRVLMAGVAGISAAYAPTRDTPEAGGLPATVAFTFPCALVLPGQSLDYILSAGQHRHTYEVRVLLLVAGIDYTDNAFVAVPMPDRVIETLAGNVTLGGRANSVVFKRSAGLSGISWAGLDYLGYEFVVEVSEQASAAPAIGG